MAVAPAESPPFIMRSHSEPVLKDWFHVTCEGTEGHHQAWGLQCTLGNQADSILTDEHTALVLSSLYIFLENATCLPSIPSFHLPCRTTTLSPGLLTPP